MVDHPVGNRFGNNGDHINSDTKFGGNRRRVLIVARALPELRNTGVHVTNFNLLGLNEAECPATHRHGNND